MSAHPEPLRERERREISWSVRGHPPVGRKTTTNESWPGRITSRKKHKYVHVSSAIVHQSLSSLGKKARRGLTVEPLPLPVAELAMDDTLPALRESRGSLEDDMLLPSYDAPGSAERRTRQLEMVLVGKGQGLLSLFSTAGVLLSLDIHLGLLSDPFYVPWLTLASSP